MIENAAEIAIEHNLGLTCDPIEGLVQGESYHPRSSEGLSALSLNVYAFQQCLALSATL